MRLIWNLFALIGLVVVVAAIYFGATFMTGGGPLGKLDKGAVAVYQDMFSKLLETGSIAEATVWKAAVSENLTFEEVDETIKSVAVENNIKGVGELPLSNQIEAMTGKAWRKVKIYMYCNPLTAAKMMDFDDAFSAYLPCRVSLVEDKTGKLWIYSLNMDMMIHGGAPLPEELKKEALDVKRIIQDVLKRGAEGDF